MIVHNLGYPRIGGHHELSEACAQYWAGNMNHRQLAHVGETIRRENLLTQQQACMELIPCNDFSFYDWVLDMALTVNAIPSRFHAVALKPGMNELDIYFAMARGYQRNGEDIAAMEKRPWFDTEEYYVVPEFTPHQSFSYFSNQIVASFVEAREILGSSAPKPVILGPVSFLLLGKAKDEAFDTLTLLPALLPVYAELLSRLEAYGAEWVQLDEPMLATALSPAQCAAFTHAYQYLHQAFPYLRILLATYFGTVAHNLGTLVNLPVEAVHIDLASDAHQLDAVLTSHFVHQSTHLSLGLIDGRHNQKTDWDAALACIRKAKGILGERRVMIAPSCSLLHVPHDHALESAWMTLAEQKLTEVATLKVLSQKHVDESGTLPPAQEDEASLAAANG